MHRARMMRTAVIAVGGLAGGVLAASPALAGAPSFECRIGTARLALDTHRATALIRRPSSPVMRSALESVEADGANQRYRLTRGSISGSVSGTVSGSVSGSVDVRGAGSTVTMVTSAGRGTGACAFVPGDFALGTVTARWLSVRADARADAAITVVLHRGSFVWLDPTATPGERDASEMVRVRVVLRIVGGRRADVAGAGGVEQQLGMGAAAGLDGRSTVIDGWVAKRGIDWTGPPGP